MKQRKKTVQKAERETEAENQVMAKEKIIDSIRKLLLFFLTVLSAALAAYLYQKTVYEIAGTAVFTAIAAGGMLFQMSEK